MFKIFKRGRDSEGPVWSREWSPHGIELAKNGSGTVLGDPLAAGYLDQLRDDGLLYERDSGYLIDWETVFDALLSPKYPGLRDLLGLPDFTKLTPVLRSSNSLTDESFSITFAGWVSPTGDRRDCQLTGAIITCDGEAEFLSREQWQLSTEVVSFARRPQDLRTDLAHRQAWGRIRKLALVAGARLDDFLHRSVVLTPEKLEIGLRKSNGVGDDSVIEIEPRFSGAPADWLERFDSSRTVFDRYDFATPEGVIQVLISPKVKTVLSEIKRLPLRRVAGSRAQAFILNPFATLGEDAKDVITEEQFEAAREEAGLHYERFVPQIERDAAGRPLRIGVLVETASAAGPMSSETHWLTNEELGSFVAKLQSAIERGFQLLGWRGYDLELQGDSGEHLATLSDALELRSKAPSVVTYAQVYDLNSYSSRIEGIGIEKPYYSPYIAKRKDDEGWFPDNVLPFIVFTPHGSSEAVAVPVSDELIKQLDDAKTEARDAGRESVSVPWLDKPVPLPEADDIISTFEEVMTDVQNSTFDPEKIAARQKEKLGKRKSLLLRANIQSLEYDEMRRAALLALPAEPQLPSSLRHEFPLMPHQRDGVAWLQHLYGAKNKYQVRGAVLADDMGLGKTLQLLTFMAWLNETDAKLDPMLVVAPVSLLENWKEEADKFLQPGSLPIVTAYGEFLAELRVPREAIETRLRTEDGLIRFLKPGWIGDAKVVLTTYETLRDLEFSFASQRWSFMVCDEAQRIKNPAAMVTRAAKKQNVGFKIACSGTPVENTLADLWCLFDYVQPGLLGALDEFGKRYRKPIEAKTDEERARVEELRSYIEPQILRRMKSDVVKDLPKKIEVEGCKNLTLSDRQRNLYSGAIEDFKGRNNAGSTSPFKNHLGLLHYLRLICTDPKRHGLTVFKPEPVREYRANAPKLDWLLKELERIKGKGEKAIVFCEFRNIQRLLQHYIRDAFDVTPDIINGDTPASSSHATSRQKRIKAFQSAPGFGVIILSPVAVGFGVNIQAANHVIHYTRTWNPAKEDQATDRAYRIGQTKDVYVYYPVVRAEDFCTFDVKLDELLRLKRALARDMLNGAGDIGPGDFSITDIVPERNAENIDEAVTLEAARRMEWRHFEGLAAAIWKKKGFDYCYCTAPANDNGVDVVAITGSEGELIQTKTAAAEGARLGWDTVKEVVGGEAYYRRRHPKVEFRKVGMSNQFFNAQAIAQAELNNVELVGQNELADLLKRFPVTMLDVERVLYGEWGEASVDQ